MKYKILVLDLDGTLTNNKKEINYIKLKSMNIVILYVGDVRLQLYSRQLENGISILMN